MSVSEEKYYELMREILLAEPYRGVCSEPTRLLDHVYIGSQSNAESLRLLRQLGITHVLNCAGYKGPRPTPNASPYEGLGIDYYEFQAEDTDRYDICQHFPEAFSYLDRAKRQGGTVLVHCALGINRSAAVCLGYLMTHSKIPLLRATKILKDKRRIVLANRAFQQQMVRYARSRGLLDRFEAEEEIEQDSGCREERIAAILRSPPRNDFTRRSAKFEHGPSRRFSSLEQDGPATRKLSTYPVPDHPSRHQQAMTLPRKTSDGLVVSRDWALWMGKALGRVKSEGGENGKWLDGVCERMDHITQNGLDKSGFRTVNERGRSFGVDGPRSQRAQSTPRLANGSGPLATDLYWQTRPLEFRY